ncbi:hypothetical protein MMC21_001558 [Puttea exsequens]|nr:hypothetical protein [Puttea exsequens]
MSDQAKTETSFQWTGNLQEPLESCTLAQPLQMSYLRNAFLCAVFDVRLSVVAMEAIDSGYQSFFDRYALLCSLAAAKNREIEYITHWELTDIIRLMKEDSHTRIQIVTCVTTLWYSLNSEAYDKPSREAYEKPDMMATLFDLAASLCLMMSIGMFPGDISYDDPVFWGISQSRSEFLEQVFSQKYESEEKVKLPQSFTAAHLEQIGGIEVIWTSNLADHLLLKDDDTKLMLFHQVSALSLYKAPPPSPVPKDLVDETIRTIALLIPPILGERNPWFLAQLRKHKIDAEAGLCDRLNSSERQIDKFHYWRDRLVLLKRTFDDAEPRTVSQLWWDDRRKTQWFTFWVAVLVFVTTIFFGVVQSVAGIVQAWASVKAMRGQGVS